MKKYLERNLGTFKLIDFEGHGHWGINFGSYYESAKESLENLPEFKGKSVKQILEIFVENNNLIKTKESMAGGCDPEPVKHSIEYVLYSGEQEIIFEDNLDLIRLTWNEYTSLDCPETLDTNLKINPSK